MTRDQVLGELHLLATVEHALLADYLMLSCALGADLESATTPAGEARNMAIDDMRHLRRVNRALVKAGRPATVHRAKEIRPDEAAPPIALGVFDAQQFATFPTRERAVAAAVDCRYARLAAALEASPDLFDDEERGLIDFAIQSASDHGEAVDGLASKLQPRPADFLRATRLEPDDDFERALLDVSDRYYRTIVAAVGASFGHEGEFGGSLLDGAVSAMEILRGVFGQLGERGLVPALRPDQW